MDISEFSNDYFDTKTWINDILNSCENQEKKESYTMSLVMKLQLYVQQVNNALEETSFQVLQSLPKIVRNTKCLQEEALSLKFKMTTVHDEIMQIETDTGKSMNTIEKLDNIKSNLESAKQGLHESDNWTALVNDLEDVFDSRNVELISQKILGMQQSLKLLIKVADYEDKKMQLEGLKNRLEASASPTIVQVFTTNNTDQAMLYTKIFSSMDRLPQLIKYYHKCQRDILLKKWRSELEIEQDDLVTKWLHNFYNLLLSNWNSQCKWFHQIFPNHAAVQTLAEIYTDVLISLDPSIKECIDAALKQTPEKLNFLYEVKQIMKHFLDSFWNIMKQSVQGEINQDKTSQLMEAIYVPLVPYVNKYAAYEQAHLMKKLSTISNMKDELQDTIQSLGLNLPSVMAIAREAKQRCRDITENCGYCGLLIALRAFFLNYIDQYRVALRQIERNKKNVEDWTSFQLCLSLLQNTGDALLEIIQFERDLTNSVLVELNQRENAIEYKYLLLNEQDRKEFESLVKCVVEGTKLSLLDHVITEFKKLCSDIHHTTYQVVFAPIASQLEIVQSSKTWNQSSSTIHNADLPDYSFSPQEYITQIGQYLLTLPQHLEPFLFRENPSLTCALKAVDEEYNITSGAEGVLGDVFLKLVAKGTCQEYCDEILSICELSNSSSRQLANDIGYLNNVLQDLGLSLSTNLQQLSVLLKIPPDQYQMQSSGCSARYVAAVRQMRNITSN